MTNFVIFLGDDQRYDLFDKMPFTRDLGGLGTVFTGCRVSSPLCQPNRLCLHTGSWAKDHGVYTNTAAALAGFDFTTLVSKHLKDTASSRNGLIGKWINGQNGTETPPYGFDTWLKIKVALDGAYGFDTYNGTSSVTVNQFEYDWIRDNALTFIAGSEPFVLFLNPRGPHIPYYKTDLDVGAWAWYQHDRTYMGEADVSDKPAWVQALTPPTEEDKRQIQAQVRRYLRSQKSLDRMVADICDAVDFSDTVVIWHGDNGYMFGEHNRFDYTTNGTAKHNLFDVSLRCPLVAAGPGFTPGQVVTQPTCTQDITATLNDVYSLSPTRTQRGTSLLDIVASPSTYNTRQLLHEVQNGQPPDCSAITTMTRKLIRYPGEVDPDKYEAYDLDTDPNELLSWGNDGGRTTERDALEDDLDDLLAS